MSVSHSSLSSVLCCALLLRIGPRSGCGSLPSCSSMALTLLNHKIVYIITGAYQRDTKNLPNCSWHIPTPFGGLVSGWKVLEKSAQANSRPCVKGRRATMKFRTGLMRQCKESKTPVAKMIATLVRVVQVRKCPAGEAVWEEWCAMSSA